MEGLTERPEQTNGWSVHTRDGITLFGPRRTEITLPYRKVGELLATLLRAPDRTRSRVHLGAQLWPASPTARQSTNLRQAIRALREAIGVDNVVADRFDCGLAESFHCAIDPKAESFTTPEWIGGWILFLEALSHSSPAQFFEAIRPNADLIWDLPTMQFAELVARASDGLPDNHPMHGWRWFAQGSVSLRDVPRASDHFLAAVRHAARCGDADLLSRSAFWLSSCQILLGRAERADGLALEALQATGARGGATDARLSAARATAFLHLGRFEESRLMMAKASMTEDVSVFERQQAEALRAFYLATSGYADEARRLLEPIRKNCDCHASGRVGMLMDLTCWSIEASETPAQVIETIGPRIRTLQAAGQHHFALYAIETLVSALCRCDFQEEARAKFFESRRVRKRLGITYSAWDARRLAPFVIPA